MTRKIRSMGDGVGLHNDDGAHRQKVIEHLCKYGKSVQLRRETDDFANPDAIGLWVESRSGWHQFGSAGSHRRDELARHLDSGGTLNAMIVDVLGGGTDHYFDVFIEYELIDKPAGPSGWLERAFVKARGSAAAVRRGFRRD